MLDTAPLKTSIRQNERSIKRLFERIEKSTDDMLATALEKRIADLQKDLLALKGKLSQAEAQNMPPPPSLDLERVQSLLCCLPELLNQAIPAAAEALRNLTGPITIRQTKEPGQKKRASWIAKFQPDLVNWLRRLAKAKDYPESITLEFLNTRNWIMPKEVTVPLVRTEKYERIAPAAVELRRLGGSVETIARALGQTRATTRDALEFGETGRRPKTKPSGKSPNNKKRTGPPKYVQLKAQVAELRAQRLSFRKIAKALGCHPSTVTRAYDLANSEPVCAAAEKGLVPKRGRYSHLPLEAFAAIENELKIGTPSVKIAKKLGCGVSTVNRVKLKISKEREDEPKSRRAR